MNSVELGSVRQQRIRAQHELKNLKTTIKQSLITIALLPALWVVVVLWTV